VEKFLDDLSIKILRELYRNAKITYNELSRIVGVSTTVCYRRVKELEKQGIIKSYTIEVNEKKLGYFIKTLIEVKTKTGVTIELVKSLGQHPNVSRIYGITGDRDAIIEAYFRNVEELDRFLKRIREICSDIVETETHIVLNEHKNMRGWF